MNHVILSFFGLLCAVVWLTLLVVTHFSGVAVGAGLLIVLCISGSTPEHRRSSVRW